MSKDGFGTLVTEARAFLNELKDNNDRDWFKANKGRYDASIRLPAKAFGAVIGAGLEDLTGTPHSTKLFRPNRDVRFSKDKTPYTTHMHILWSPGPGAPGWFFGVAPDYVTAGCGVMAFDKAQLAGFRARVDADGAAIAALLDGLTSEGYRLDPPELKRVPPPFPKDHAHGELLRRKSLALWRDVSGPGDPTGRIMTAFRELKPVFDLIRTL